MQAREVSPPGAERTWVLVFETDDEPMSGLRRFTSENRVTTASFQAIGAFSAATLGWLNWDTRDYEPIRIDEQVEVLSLLGDVAAEDGEPSVHAHAVVGKQDGTAHGGHLMEATVRPTLEVILTEAPPHLRKRRDPASGLALIDLDQ